uniref:Shugoshin C-terminal domain-containing protein n=1 Tax=Oryza punctata TaxID=4537 RepID=A0A0E0K6D7_ORYPU
MAAAAGAAARGGGVVPGGKGGGHGGLRSPGKPVVLADITNTGRPNPPGSVHAVADVLKENAKLRHLLAERNKVIEVSRVELQKIRLALHAMQQKNLQLVQANSQMFAEINQGKDRIKLLQHELACTIAVLKVKGSELERTSKAANNQQNEAKILEKKARSSKHAPTEAHQKVTGSIREHLVEIQSAVPSYTSCHEPPQDKTNKRCTNRRKSGSFEVTVDTNTVGYVQSSGSSHDEDPRKTLRRRSARLNPESFEVTEIPCDKLHEDATVPSAPSSSNVRKQQEPNAGKDMICGGKMKSLQNELPCDAIAQVVEAPELKEIQEAGSSVAGIEAHKFDIEDPEPPRKSMCIDANKRKLESCESRSASNKEDCINAICDSTSSMPIQHQQKRKLSRRKSSRLDPGPCEVTNGTFEIVQEDTVAPSSSSNVLIEQTKNDMQNGRSCSTKPSEEQVIGRRSSVGRPSRRAAEKIVSYREVPLNIKMRRP